MSIDLRCKALQLVLCLCKLRLGAVQEFSALPFCVTLFLGKRKGLSL